MTRLVVLIILCLAAVSQSIAATEPDMKSIKFDSGYIQITDKDHFFYLLARSKVTNAPLVIFLNGGPGASSMTGAFLENGPLRLTEPFNHDKNYHLIKNRWAWNNLANIVYLDQPRYTGFSYGKGAYVTSLQEVGKDFLTWLNLFYQKYPEFKNRTLYLAGESFAGAYIGIYDHQILIYNQQNKNHPIHLSGLFVQAGVISDDFRFSQLNVSPTYRLDFLCTQNMLPTTDCQLDQKNSFAFTLRQCINHIANTKHIHPENIKMSDLYSSGQSIASCNYYLHQISPAPKFTTYSFADTGIFPQKIRGKTLPEPIDTLEFAQDSKIRRFLQYSPNPFNIKLVCKSSGGYPPWCYDNYKITQFFNDPHIKTWLGNNNIPSQIKWEFTPFPVATALTVINPLIWPLESYYAEALRHHIKVTLVYGKNDWLNYLAAQSIADQIATRAYGHTLFKQLPASESDLKNLSIQNKNKTLHTGEYQTWQNLTFAQINNAGHIIGMDDPETIYQLYKIMIEEKP